MVYDQLMAIHGRGGGSICLGHKGFTCLGLSALGYREATHCAWISSRSQALLECFRGKLLPDTAGSKNPPMEY